MPSWKLNIFINAIKTRGKLEEIIVEDIINEYTKLTNMEKLEIFRKYFKLKTVYIF